jgi:hypothetical protein
MNPQQELEALHRTLDKLQQQNEQIRQQCVRERAQALAILQECHQAIAKSKELLAKRQASIPMLSPSCWPARAPRKPVGRRLAREATQLPPGPDRYS